MPALEFTLKEEFIPLIKLLKVLCLVDTGGMAQLVVEDGLVKLNGEVEYRKRAKLRTGDIVQFDAYTIRII